MVDLGRYDLGDFKASEEKDMQGGEFELIPQDHYVGMLIDAEDKETRKGDGRYLALTWELLAEPNKGRRLWANLNLVNKNQKAVAIARQELGAIIKAAGRETIQTTDELMNIPVLLFVKIEKGKDGYADKNVIKGYSPASGTVDSVSGGSVKEKEEQAVEKKAPLKGPWDN